MWLGQPPNGRRPRQSTTGQATWEQRLTPSSGHGVTSVVMGNCGVGFAPCKPAQRELLGLAKALDLLMSARKFDADEALSLGVVDRVLPSSFATADFKEGVAHLVEKRPAAFTGH